MWRRLNGWSKDQTISDPMLFDTTMDEAYLETIPEVDSLKSARSSMALPGLPELPFKPIEPLQTVQQEPDEDRTSSVYSQPSPHIPQEPLNEPPPIAEEPPNPAPDIRRRASSLYSAVSPLHTPRASEDLGISDDQDVSPIEPVPPIPLLPKHYLQPRSQLPLPRKAVPDAGLKTIAKKTDTRWDDYSGEPTTSEKGRESAVKPGTRPIELQYPDLKEKTRQILAGLRERGTGNLQGSGKISPSTQIDPLDNPPRREPWKGASGRTALVEPVRNNPAARLERIQIPANNIRRAEPTTNNTSRVVTPSSSTIKPVPSESAKEDIVRPPPPLRLGKNSPAVRSPVTADPPQLLESPSQSPQHPDTVHISVTLPTPNPGESMESTGGSLTPITPTPSRPSVSPPRSDNNQDSTSTNPSPVLDTANPQPRSDSLQPVHPANEDLSSRFSWTTYATTVNDSPPETPRADTNPPPVPYLPTGMPTPLVMRKRPVQSQVQSQPLTSPTAPNFPASQYANVVARKPTPADRRRASTLLSTASNLSKSLPQCPPEMEAPDKISSLEARMEEFARRKRNVNKLINQLKSGVQPSNIAFDLRTREEVKRTIKGLEGELAEIIQEEHDVGLRLHRAQRKRDREEMYENPTGLWIKRVTMYNV